MGIARGSLLALLMALTALAPLAAQPWRGRAHGVVLGPDGEPLAGARVTLRPEAVAAAVGVAAPVAGTTGNDGRWALVLAAPGVWTIEVEADGCHPAEGFVRVPAEGAAEAVEVALRSLAEVPPVSEAELRAPEPPERPVLAPEAHRRGRYRTAFAERSSLSDPAVVVPRYGGTEEDLSRLAPDARYQLAEETFEVYVPEGYAPAGAAAAPEYGLLVWVSPTRAGGVERPELRPLLDERRLLWVGANSAGNPRSSLVRAGLALDAAQAMAGLYDLDPERIYVAGYSGGGRMASQLAMLFPEVFRGALALFGASFFRPVPVPDRPGHHWPAAFPEPPAETLRRIRRETRLVLVTGERDFNRAQTRAVERALAADGFERVTYVEVPGASHYQPFDDQERLREALAALDL